MKLDYEEILKDNGFDSVPEADTTAHAFHIEIHATLFEEDSPFDEGESSIDELPDLLEHMVCCALQLKKGKSIEEGVTYLINKWCGRLSYQNPRYESIVRTTSVFGTEVRIFTVSQGSACSFLFTVKDESAAKAIQDFIDGYSPVDDPEEVSRKISSLNKQ